MEIDPVSSKVEARYEKRDANIRSLVMFAAGLFMILVATLFAMAKLFKYFTASQSLGPPASPFSSTRPLPPQPRLQVEPHEDLRRYREAEEELLHSYGWVDQKAGVVRIPIERAMDLIAQRGLPVSSDKTGKAKAK
jgi:hypothetical protein